MTAIDRTRFQVGDMVDVRRVYTPPTSRSHAQLRGQLSHMDEHGFRLDGESRWLCWDPGRNIEQTMTRVDPRAIRYEE
ncbi:MULTISPECIES: hypothetical protein [Nocardia]|uniref:hypothetical protein n=1 Tax=Nocardia TaxID=1817 RepID=UPI000D68C5A1|nr:MULTISPECIES: hypothetical protein [Nocardia]